MRYTITARVTRLLLLAVLCLTGCITPGPVKEGPVTTAAVQDLGLEAATNNAAIATRNILANYSGKMAMAWRTWSERDAKMAARTPPAGMSPEQTTQWADALAQQRIRLVEARDDKLQTYDLARAAELEQVTKNDRNLKKALANIVASWAAQGEVSRITAAGWFELANAGLALYQQHQHIRRLRKEAEEAERQRETEEGE